MNLSNADALEIAMIANVAKQILIVNYSVDVHAQNKAQAKMVLDFEIWRGGGSFQTIYFILWNIINYKKKQEREQYFYCFDFD
jgi:hypothetical protein